MTGENRKHPKLPAAGPEYEVGYGKPPVKTRFKPGQSGNPGGRAKGSKNKQPAPHEEPFKNVILKEAYRQIAIYDGTKNIRMPMAQAVVRSIGVKAGKGDHRSQRLFVEMVSSVEAQAKAQNNEWLETMINYKVTGERELERRKRLGISGPDMIPHPNDIHIDFENNTVTVIGPFTKQEKEHHDIIRELRTHCWEKIDQLGIKLNAQKSKAERAEIENKIRSLKSAVKKIDATLGLG
jgi:hypothetical protein